MITLSDWQLIGFVVGLAGAIQVGQLVGSYIAGRMRMAEFKRKYPALAGE